MAKSIVYKSTKCIGCGICYTDAPHIFECDIINAKAVLLDGMVKNDNYLRVLWPDELQLMQAIVKLCSVKAIQII